MMYIHYCKYCRRIHILNGHKVYCPACSGKLTELGISYMKYVNLSKTERGLLKEKCADEKGLKELSVEYRMHRYSKWFKNLPAAGDNAGTAAPAPSLASTDNKQARLPEYRPATAYQTRRRCPPQPLRTPPPIQATGRSRR